ncbi:XrtA-associated tyrosine autokinase [Motilimonas sp. KMU-193]|uniref:XrtA-associated tyrosine autokinase n=1 Tax=Motilimonas sp. KMU-193 TaxID=3388668 RepID=UPI00396B2A4B
MSIIEKALAKKQQHADELAKQQAQDQADASPSEVTQTVTNSEQTSDSQNKVANPATLNTAPPSNPVSSSSPASTAQPQQTNKDAPPTPYQPSPRPAHQASELQSLNLNLNHLKQQGFLVDSNERSQTHEEFRFVKRRVLKTAFGPLKDTLPNANLVLLTSALSNEGKTHTAINLALSIAMEPEKTVLLVDADVLSPSICHTLGVRAGVGLIDYLLGKTSTLQEIIYNTNIPNLRIMPAGGKHHLTSELLASERMASLASELAERYADRVIIFDAPPLLGINETQALTSFVGQQLIVVEENKTPLHSLETAISLLNADRAIGLVLNKSVQTKNLYAGYGYQYAENQ